MKKFIKTKLTIVVSLVLLTSPAFSSDEEQFSIKFGGWSNHADKKNMAGRDWNENHTGLGLKYTKYLDTNVDLIAEAWVMKDSYFEPSGYLGIGASYKLPIENKYLGVSINVLGSVLSRKMHAYYSYDDTLESERKISFLPSYYVTFNIMEKIDIDMTYIPSGFGNIQSEVYFMRLGYKF